jgi:hypothetical protein
MTSPGAKLIMTLSCALLVLQGPLWAKDRTQGRTKYEAFCASCHGKDAKGNGLVASQLSIPPPDLTQLAKKNGGVFPQDTVMEKIDGRLEVKAHGSRDMPVWGRRFTPLRSEGFNPTESVPWTEGPASERDIRKDILVLVQYLHSLQEK